MFGCFREDIVSWISVLLMEGSRSLDSVSRNCEYPLLPRFTHVYLLFHLYDFFSHYMDDSGLNAEWELLD